MADPTNPNIDRTQSLYSIPPVTPQFSKMNSSSIIPHHTHSSWSHQCFKVFVVAAIALAAITIVVGSLALVASKGGFPPGLHSINQLAVIGEINSYVMISAGVGLFAIGVVAWSCHIRKEHKSLSSSLVRQADSSASRQLSFDNVTE